MKKLLTAKNIKMLRTKLKDFLLEALEENYKTIADCRAEAERSHANVLHTLTLQDVKEHLQELSLGMPYTYCAGCRIILNMLGMSEQDIEKLGKDYAEDMYNIGQFFWNTLADIIYND